MRKAFSKRLQSNKKSNTRDEKISIAEEEEEEEEEEEGKKEEEEEEEEEDEYDKNTIVTLSPHQAVTTDEDFRHPLPTDSSSSARNKKGGWLGCSGLGDGGLGGSGLGDGGLGGCGLSDGGLGGGGLGGGGLGDGGLGWVMVDWVVVG